MESNLKALKIVLNWDGTSRLSDEDYQVLSRFSGWGNCKGILDIKQGEGITGPNKELYQELIELIAESYPETWEQIVQSIKNATLTSYFTNPVIPRTFYQVLEQYMPVLNFYEPSAGSGVFYETFIDVYHSQAQKKLYEKDVLTAQVLKCIAMYRDRTTMVRNKPFEESEDKENGNYDLICSNIPFADVKVFDPKFKDNNLTGKLHNYFFAKGIDKIRNGGVLAYVTTDAFLNSVTNRTARKYLFDRCDFISLTVFPDNLFTEAGTKAPSHFLVVRKRDGKSELSDEEKLLVHSEFQEIDGVKVAMNQWIYSNTLTGIRIGESKLGKNQYGKPCLEVHWDRPIEEIAEPFREILERDFERRWIGEKIEQEEEVPADPGFPSRGDDEYESDDEIEKGWKELRGYEMGKPLQIQKDVPWEELDKVDAKTLDTMSAEELATTIEEMFKPRSEWEQELSDNVRQSETVDNISLKDIPVAPGIPIEQMRDIVMIPKEYMPKHVPYKDGMLIVKEDDND